MSSWIIETLVATTLLMLLVMAVRKPVARRYGAKAAYALWLAPALRLFLPPLPAEWLSAREVILAGLPAVAPATDWMSYAVGFWIVGAVGFLGWHLLGYARFANEARDKATWLRADGRIEIGESPSVKAPVAFGLLWQTVMLPADFQDRYSPAEQRLSITHELTHHRRRDLAANMLALIMLALHWFNPLARAAYRAFRTDQEAACDADVLAQTAPHDRHAYGTALLKSALADPPLAACSAGVASTLKERLRRIAILDEARPTLIASLCLLAMLLLSMLLSASTRYVQDQTIAAPNRAPSYLATLTPSIESGALPVVVEAKIEKVVEVEPVAQTVTAKLILPRLEEEPAPAPFEQPNPKPQPVAAPEPVEAPEPQVVLAKTKGCAKRKAQLVTFVDDRTMTVRTMSVGTPCVDTGALAEARARIAIAAPAIERARAAIASDQVLDPRIRNAALAELDAELADLNAELAELNAGVAELSSQRGLASLQ
jgi:bla regulator protein blaR1